MQQHIILLRAVNVSGKNLIKMADLKKHLSDYGYLNVQTYIQSGNIILSSEETDVQVQKNIQQIISEKFSHLIDVFVVNKEILEKTLKKNPFPEDYAPNKTFATFFSHTISPEYANALRNADTGDEKFIVDENFLYFHLPDGAANAKLSNTFFEQKLKTKATTRNINTLRKLLEMS